MSSGNWLLWLLGVRGIEVESIRHASLQFSTGVGMLAVLGGLVLAGSAIGALTYARTTEPISRRKRLAFSLARFMVYLCLAFALSGLALNLRIETARKPSTLILVDNTLSMSLKAPEGMQPGKGKANQAQLNEVPRRIDLVLGRLQGPLISQIGEKRKIRILPFEGPEMPIAGPHSLEPVADRTDIPSVLEQVLKGHEADGVSEIILLTDGRNTVPTRGKLAGEVLADRGIRLFCLVAGSDSSFRDVRLASASAGSYCRAFDQLVISFKINHLGCNGERVKLNVHPGEDARKILGGTEVILRQQPGAQHGLLILPPPRKAGILHLVVQVEEVPGELTAENNRRDIFVQVVDEPIKVLLVDNFPRAEFKHIKASLDRDPNIALTLLNRMPGGAWQVQGRPLLEKPELGFPAEPGDLWKYDVLVLGSISRGYFSAGDTFEERKLTNIARFVSERGGGLIVLGGHRSFGQGKYQGSPIEPLLPFELPKAGEESFLTQETRAELTPLGRLHPVVQLADTVEENAKLWDDLPRLMGCNIVGSARPAAEVLAVSSEHVGGKKPILLACQSYGYGRVFACTTYSTFRWRLGSPVEKGDLLARFWCQAVRYVSPDPRVVAQALNIQPDKTHYVRGEVARLWLRPVDAYYSPLRREEIELRLQKPDRTPLAMLLREDPARRGLYPAEVELEQQGEYEISAESRKGLKEHLTVRVGPRTEEFDDPGAEMEWLSAVSSESGGEMLPIGDADRLAGKLMAEPIRSEERLEVPLWDSPVLLFTILALCLGEWFFRKRSGLA